MRSDRLIAALLLLQARGRVTAARLAEELEVSVATARATSRRCRPPASPCTRSRGAAAGGP